MTSSINASTAAGGGVITTADASGILALQTAGTTAVTINGSQNVGIGTSSPATKLTLADGQITVVNSGASNPAINFKGNGSGASGFQVGQNYNAQTLYVYDNAASAQRLTIDSSGNVGIGTSSPGEKLQVVGSIRLSSTGTLYSNTYSAGNTQTWMVNNATSGDVYLTADTAQRYRQLTGIGHVWETAASGSAGGAVTWSEKMRIDSSGNLLVGTTANVIFGGTEKISVLSSDKLFAGATTGNTAGGYWVNKAVSATNGTYLTFYNGSGGANIGAVTCSATTTAYLTSSDYRLKENIQPMQNALATVSQLKPCTYTWKADGSDGQGFIAHELQAVVPDCVTGEKDGVETYTDEEGNEQTRPKYQGIDTSFLVATLTAAIQELKAELDEVKAQLKGAQA